MASRKRMMWTRVAIVATLTISVPSLSSAQAQRRAQGRQAAPRLPHKVLVVAAAAEAARSGTPRQPAQRT